MATVFALAGWDVPANIVAQFFNGYFVDEDNDLVVPLTLAQPNLTEQWELPGAIPEADLAELEPAVAQLDLYITNQLGPKVVIATGYGSIIASLWLKNYAPTSVVYDELSFVLASNPVRKLGGALQSPTTDIPDDVQYPVQDIALQFDGWADWPENLPRTSADLGVVNAAFSLTAGANQYMLAVVTNPDRAVMTTGNLTHILLPQYPVPILIQNPIPEITEPIEDWIRNNPLIAAADRVLRPIIESVYNRIIGAIPYPNYPQPEVTPPITVPGQLPGAPIENFAPCLDQTQFYVSDGGIRPFPWMQERLVASGSVAGESGSLDASSTPDTLNELSLGDLFGNFVTPIAESVTADNLSSGIGGNLIKPVGELLHLDGSLGPLFSGVSASQPENLAASNKNRLLQSLVVRWTNITPTDQWIYGLITRGGSRLTLQARSRGYLVVLSSYNEGLTPKPLTISSIVGCGADIGMGGALAMGTSYAIMEERMNAVTIPLAPERCGWTRIPPGVSFTAAAQVRFVSEFWETGQIDGGSGETESSFDTGELRLDLFALPALDYEP